MSFWRRRFRFGDPGLRYPSTRNGPALGGRPWPSRTSVERFVPGGWSNQPAISAGPQSIVSGQNLRKMDGRLEPRPHLQQLGSTLATIASVNTPTSAGVYYDVNGLEIPVVSSTTLMWYLDGTSWTTLTYTASGITNEPPTGGDLDFWRGDSVYLERADCNIYAITNGVNYMYAWGGPLVEGTFSTLTEAPIAKDVTVFQNRLVAWNIYADDIGQQLVTRVQWCENGDPEDWSGIGAGNDDILDMRGVGTRIFTFSEYLILATDREIWIGRPVGLPFIFEFQPLTSEVGMPFPNAAVHTHQGLFFMGHGGLVWQLRPDLQLVPIGTPIQRKLRNEITATDEPYTTISWDDSAEHVTVFYRTNGTQKAMCWCVDEGVWTPEAYGHSILFASQGPKAAGTAAIQWDALTGNFTSNRSTFLEKSGLGNGPSPTPFVLSSGGTAYSLSSNASNDDNAAVLHEVWFGANYAPTGADLKFVNRVRLDVHGRRASTLSVAITDNLQDSALFSEQTISIPATSGTSQYKLDFEVTATYPQLVIRSQSTDWSLDAVMIEAEVKGRSF